MVLTVIVIYLLKMFFGKLDFFVSTYLWSYYTKPIEYALFLPIAFSSIFVGLIAFNPKKYKNKKPLTVEILLVSLLFNVFLTALPGLAIWSPNVHRINIARFFMIGFLIETILLALGSFLRAILTFIKKRAPQVSKQVKLVGLAIIVVGITFFAIHFIFDNSNGSSVFRNNNPDVKILNPLWVADDKVLFTHLDNEGSRFNFFDLSTRETIPLLEKYVDANGEEQQRWFKKEEEGYMWFEFDHEAGIITDKIFIKDATFSVKSTSPSGKFLIGIFKESSDTSIFKIFDMETNTYSTISDLDLEKDIGGWIAIFDNGDILYVNQNFEIKIRSFEDNSERIIHKYDEEYRMPTDMTISPDNKFVALNFDNLFRPGIAIGVLDLSSGEMEFFHDWVYQITLSKWTSDSKHLVTLFSDSKLAEEYVLVLDNKSNEIKNSSLHKGFYNIRHFDISPDNSKIIFGLDFKELRIYNLNL